MFFTRTFGEEVEISVSWLERSKNVIRLVTFSEKQMIAQRRVVTFFETRR
jgi:hypothetical protein